MDASVKPNTDIQYFDVEHVWDFDYDNYYLIRLYENSDLDYGRSTRNDGVMCMLVDDTNVYMIRQYGKKADWTFDITIAYVHGLKVAPCIHMMGVPVVVNGRLLWQSPYRAAAEVLDIALADSNYLQASKVKTNYPQVVMVGDDCEYTDRKLNGSCVRGKLMWSTEEGEAMSTECPGCGGSGKRHCLGPLNELIISSATNTSVGEGVNATNALAFVAPATDNLRFSREEVEYNLNLARRILHVDGEAPMAGGDAKTATEAGLNNKAKDAFVKPIADQMFVIFDFALQCIAGERAAAEGAYTLNPPQNYDLRTTADYMVELQQAMGGGMPPAVISRIIDDVLYSRYRDDQQTLDEFEAIAKADEFMYMPSEVFTAEAASGRIEPWQIALHYGALYYYRLVMTDVKGDPDAQAVADLMITKAQEMETKPEGSSALAKLSAAMAKKPPVNG